MLFVPQHRIEFECVDDPKLDVPMILNSIVEFKEGMVFKLVRPYTESGKTEEIQLIVTGVEIELLDYVEGEIHCKVFVKRV